MIRGPPRSKRTATLFPYTTRVRFHGWRVRPRSFALRASRPAAITLRGFEVLVQLVMAAMITAPSGILPSAGSSHGAAMPRSASAEVGRRLCGFDEIGRAHV